MKTQEHKPPKFINIQINDNQSQQNFCNAIANADILNKLNHSPNADPNDNYNILCDTIQTLKDKYLPTKTVKFHKHKHKNSPWITISIIKSIQKKDKLYAKLLSTEREHSEYQNLKTNLCTCNTILKKNIRNAKQSYYQDLLRKYQGNIKKTWSTVNMILNKTSSKNDFPSTFLLNGSEIKDTTDISNKFNEYFATIGPKLAAETTNTNNKPYTSYLKNKVNF